MYVITYKGKPATLRRLYTLNGSPPWYLTADNDQEYLAYRTRKAAIERYIYHFGFSWRERSGDVECQKVGGW